MIITIDTDKALDQIDMRIVTLLISKAILEASDVEYDQARYIGETSTDQAAADDRRERGDELFKLSHQLKRYAGEM